jgi:hypothetical protein
MSLNRNAPGRSGFRVKRVHDGEFVYIEVTATDDDPICIDVESVPVNGAFTMAASVIGKLA